MSNNIIFAKTRYTYDSYQDFWKLVELSGFPTCYVDEIQFSGDIYITAPLNGELKPFITQHFPYGRKHTEGCFIFLWNLERPAGSGNLRQYIDDNMNLTENGIVDDIIVSDIRLGDQTGFLYIPMGSHKDLGNPGTIEQKRYDLIHLSCPSYNRSWLFKDNETCLTDIHGISIAPNGWGEERHQRLQQSKFMLNVHQDMYKHVEPLRFALAAAYGLPVITEELYPSQFYAKHVYEVAGFQKIETLVYNYDRMKSYDFGMAFREYLTETHTFRELLENYICYI